MSPETAWEALRCGAERVAAWADLLDRINVFPVADGDTGRNLALTLSPLLNPQPDPGKTAGRLLFLARGNSGNIAAHFLAGLLPPLLSGDLAPGVRLGRKRAHEAVAKPKPGTMLSYLEALEEVTGPVDLPDRIWAGEALEKLAQAVRRTTGELEELSRAGVVDAGALGLHLFMEGFLPVLTGAAISPPPPTRTFNGALRLDRDWQPRTEEGWCIDAVLEAGAAAGAAAAKLGQEVVSSRAEGFLKIHLHAPDREAARRKLGDLGRLVSFQADDLGRQTGTFAHKGPEGALQVVTDGAGSLSRELAEGAGIIILDSYLNLKDATLPETLCPPEYLYQAMREGQRVSTSQASLAERHQHYEKLLALFGRVLYLAVGGVFTGNLEAVRAWKERHDPDDRLTVLDSGAASGRLGIMALNLGRHSRLAARPEEVLARAGLVREKAREYLFLERLAYLARGGRVNPAVAWLGQALGRLPVICPGPAGVERLGWASGREKQLAFLLERLEADALADGQPEMILLEYTDNLDWVSGRAAAEVSRLFPEAEVIMTPLSLTTGAHTGPGSWGAATLPTLANA